MFLNLNQISGSLMKIDKNKLIDLLVEKTEMGREEVEDQLDQLIERILDAAKRGKALEIKEFGVFYFDEEGELSFDYRTTEQKVEASSLSTPWATKVS